MFRKLLFIAFSILTLASCKDDKPKDYITIEGKIANSEVDHLDINYMSFNKRIMVNTDGSFKDTLRTVKQGYHTFTDGKNKELIHIKNGNVLNIQYDYKDYVNSVKYSGKGYETSKYLIERKKLDKKEGILQLKSYFKLSPKEFTEKIKRVESELATLLKSDNIDKDLRLNEQGRNKKMIAYLKKNYAKQHEYLTKFMKGIESPKFVNYEKYGGGKVSLDDFKGKYVYIDVWATWCGPCKREIPHLKELVKEYKGKKIAFVSISVDNGRGYKNDKNKAKLAWKRMIFNENMMNWTQLYADKAWYSDFVKAYGITSIPRFILINPEGKIENANAPRPSNKALKQILDELLK